MIAVTYLLLGAAYYAVKVLAVVALLSAARSRGHAVPEPKSGVVSHALTILIWPIDAAVIAWLLARGCLAVLSRWRTSRRLRVTA